MNEPANPPPPYRVTYSERVRVGLVRLGAKAKECGRGPQFVTALKEIDRRLHIYPQFGEPLQDLQLKPAKTWIGVVPPLVVKYTLDEERRLVIVAVPLEALPRSGF